MSIAMSVVKKFVNLSQSGIEKDPLTNHRIQKLLYYSQGWSIAIRDCALFSEQIVAAKRCVLVPRIYKALPKTGIVPSNHSSLSECEELYSEENHFIECVWESYKMHSATKLAEMVLSESPWKLSYEANIIQKGFAIIHTSVIAKFFASLPIPEPLARFSQILHEEELAAEKRIQQLPKLNLDKLPGKLISRTKSLKEK